jgi:REP element-mobilizing transposase RayT
MPSTYLSLHYHVVFSTKNRQPFIAKSWRSQFHQYIGGTLRGMDAIAECVGGVSDHVHILMRLRATHCLADVMRELKKVTSVCAGSQMRDQSGICAAFAWQEGYAAFTVSATACADVCSYIENQEEHHRVKTFREELMEMLERAGVDYRPEYLD